MLSEAKFAVLLYVLLILTSGSSFIEGSLSDKDGHARTNALDKFFASIDKDKNGQIEAREASQYIAANFGEADVVGSSVKAAQQMKQTLDGSDPDATVSKEEVETHLKHLLKGNRLAEWVKHSLQMPQYADTFRRNAVTSLDFPSLMADGGKLLETELGIKSKLHKEQISRAMKRLLLGLGELPSAPQSFEATAVQCNAVSASWQLPEKLGQPHLHKLRLERHRVYPDQVNRAKHGWELVSEDLDEESHSFLDSGVAAAVFKYRLTAWNAMGRSESSLSAATSTDNASLPCPPGRCWRTGSCKTSPPLLGLNAGHQKAGILSGAWPVLLSVLGVFLLGYSVVVFSTGKDFWQEFFGGLGLGALASAFSKRKDVENSSNSIAIQPKTAAQAFSEQLAVRSSQQNPLHIFTDVRRGSSKPALNKEASPSKKPWTSPGRSDFFSTESITDLRGALPQQSRTPGNLSASDTASPVMSCEQQVLWLNDEGQEVEAPPALEIPPSPKDIGRHGCAYPTCEKGLHPIFNPRSAMTSHYCSICQNVYCYRHTRYSPHGKFGSCGMESKCICQLCFNDLPRITQERLERTNKLQPKPKKEKEVQPSAPSTNSKEKESRRKLSVLKNGNGYAQVPRCRARATAADGPRFRDGRRFK